MDCCKSGVGRRASRARWMAAAVLAALVLIAATMRAL
jgi:hypothetical protein